jgi:hypothetical protein
VRIDGAEHTDFYLPAVCSAAAFGRETKGHRRQTPRRHDFLRRWLLNLPPRKRTVFGAAPPQSEITGLCTEIPFISGGETVRTAATLKSLSIRQKANKSAGL